MWSKHMWWFGMIAGGMGSFRLSCGRYASWHWWYTTLNISKYSHWWYVWNWRCWFLCSDYMWSTPWLPTPMGEYLHLDSRSTWHNRHYLGTCICYLRKMILTWTYLMGFWTLHQDAFSNKPRGVMHFSVVPLHERSNLSGHYSVCALVRLDCLCQPPPPPPGNEITPDLAWHQFEPTNFSLSHPHAHPKWDNTRFGLIQIWTEKIWGTTHPPKTL